MKGAIRLLSRRFLLLASAGSFPFGPAQDGGAKSADGNMVVKLWRLGNVVNEANGYNVCLIVDNTTFVMKPSGDVFIYDHPFSDKQRIRVDVEYYGSRVVHLCLVGAQTLSLDVSTKTSLQLAREKVWELRSVDASRGVSPPQNESFPGWRTKSLRPGGSHSKSGQPILPDEMGNRGALLSDLQPLIGQRYGGSARAIPDFRSDWGKLETEMQSLISQGLLDPAELKEWEDLRQQANSHIANVYGRPTRFSFPQPDAPSESHRR